jgi:hypothetical protein
MGAYLLNQEDSVPVAGENHQPVVVPSDFKNQPVV